jgi:hypothetical protein
MASTIAGLEAQALWPSVRSTASTLPEISGPMVRDRRSNFGHGLISESDLRFPT